MGLDTFPLLQDQTYLIAYRNTVFKLKLEYQHVSQQMKEAFVQVVSEREAHCQIEDVCRAILYNIEREEPLSPIQSEHFVIYPEVHRWPLANKVQFFVHGKQLNCHQHLILLKLFCKGYSASVPDQNQVAASSSGKPRSPRPSHDTSQATSRSEESNKKNAGASCPGDTNTKKSSSEVVSSAKDNAPVCETPVVRLCNITQYGDPGINHEGTILPQQQHCSKDSNSATDDEKCPSHMEKSCLETSLRTGTTVNNVLTDKNKHKKTMERSLRGRYDHNISRRNKHQVNEISPVKFRQSTQQAPEQVHSMLNKLTTLQGEKVPQSEYPYNNSKTEHLCGSDVKTYQNVSAPHSPENPSALHDEQPAHDQHEVICETNNKVMPKRITRSELRKRYSYNNLVREGFRTSNRRCVASQIKNKVTSSNPHQTQLVRSVKTNINSTGLTQVSKQKYTRGRNKSTKTCDTAKHNMKHKSTCNDMKQHRSLEISDKHVVELSEDGKTLCESKKIINHGRDTPVSPYVTLRKRKQSISAKYQDDTNGHGVCRHRSQSAESGEARRLSDKARRLSGKARRLSEQRNSTDIVYERRQIKGHDILPASRSSSDSSQISVRSRRIATKYNFSTCSEQSAPQSKYEASFKKKVINLEAKERVMFHSRNKVGKNTGSRGKSLSCDSLKRITRSCSVSSLSGETDTTSRSSHSKRKVLSLSPALNTKRGQRVPDALAEAHQHLLEAKDGVWLFWKSGKS